MGGSLKGSRARGNSRRRSADLPAAPASQMAPERGGRCGSCPPGAGFPFSAYRPMTVAALALLFIPLIILLPHLAQADVNTSVLPDVFEWAETARTQQSEGQTLVWSPNGTQAVQGSIGTVFWWQEGVFAPSAPRVVNATLSDTGVAVYPSPVVIECAQFTPNGSWFVAVFSVPPASEALWGTPESNNTSIHFGIWDANSWALVTDTTIATWGSLNAGNSSDLPMRFEISPAGDRLLMWFTGYVYASQIRGLEIRSFPALVQIANGTFQGVEKARWSPSGSEIALTSCVYCPGGLPRGLTLLNGTTLATINSVGAANTSFSSVSWSADGAELAATTFRWGSSFPPPPTCVETYAITNVTVEVLAVPSLAVQHQLWSSDSGSARCGMAEDSELWGRNGSASATFHPLLGYVLVTHAGVVEVVNTTFWNPVFEANLSTAPSMATQAEWLGRTVSFSLVFLWTQAPQPPTGWYEEIDADRAIYVVSPHELTANVSLAGANGTVDLLPGLLTPDVTFTVSLNSTPYAYAEVVVTAGAPGSAFALSINLTSLALSQVNGSEYVAVVAVSVLSPWDGRSLVVGATLLPSWAIRFDGAWAITATIRLWNGSAGSAEVTGTLVSHLEVELEGPLEVRDAVRGLLSGGGFVNATPTLALAWGDAHFTFESRPLNASSFLVQVLDSGGVVASRPLGSNAWGSISSSFSAGGSSLWLRLALVNELGTQLDRTNLTTMLQVDREAPAVTIGTPSNDTWTAALAAVVNFTAFDGGSGMLPDGASLWISDLDGAADFGNVAATAGQGAACTPSVCAFNATGPLPPGAAGRVTIRISVRDLVGNEGLSILVLMVDRAPPTITVEGPANGSWVAGDNASVGFAVVDEGAGVSLAGATVTVSVLGGAAAFASAYASPVGGTQGDPVASFTAVVALPPGSSGRVTFSIRGVDAVGNAAEMEVQLQIDREPPTLVVTGWPEWPNASGFSIQWTCSEAGVGFDGRAQSASYSPTAAAPVLRGAGTRVVASPQTLQLTSHFAAQESATSTAWVECTDALGNRVTSPPRALPIDLTPPEAIGHAPGADEILLAPAVNFTLWLRDPIAGVRAGGVSCRFSIDAGTTYSGAVAAVTAVQANGSVEAACSVALSEGSQNRVRIVAWDNANNSVTLGPYSVRVDVPPSVGILAPTGGSTVYGSLVALKAEVVDADNDVVSVEWYLVPSGERVGEGPNATAVLPPGNFAVEVRVSDAAGHVVTRAVPFIVEDTKTGPSDMQGWLLAGLPAVIGAAVLLAWLRRRRTA